jgi:hypothetical protein
MNRISFALVLAVVAGVICPSFAAPETAKANQSEKLRHVVVLKFKDGTTAEQTKKVETAFRELKTKIPQIAGLEWGTNVSPEKHSKGFTHCFVLTFKSAADRDAYLVHPAHKAFGSVLGPVMADVFVVDFWAKN